jgi:hypothetical protein
MVFKLAMFAGKELSVLPLHTLFIGKPFCLAVPCYELKFLTLLTLLIFHLQPSHKSCPCEF